MTVRQLIEKLEKVKCQDQTVWYLYENGHRVMCPMSQVEECKGYVKIYLGKS